MALDENGVEIVEAVEEDITRDDKRLRTLSSKVEKTSKERDEAETARLAAEKERDFYKGFSGVSTKYPSASEFQDKILEKVNAGYDIEDATVSVLNKEGKLTAPPPTPPANAAGGSAITDISAGGSKTVADMTQAERRQALLDAEKRGDISV